MRRQFIVMFRSRFSDCFPKSLSHYGPQDIENGVVSTVPGEHVENLLCALIALVLNRKKPVEYVIPLQLHCVDELSQLEKPSTYLES
jgi:hypothetical protein